MSMQAVRDKVIYPVVATLAVLVISSLFNLYNSVQANTKFREDAEKREMIWMEMNNSIVELTTEVKYLRKDIDDLKQVNKAVVMASKSNQIERSTTKYHNHIPYIIKALRIALKGFLFTCIN